MHSALNKVSRENERGASGSAALSRNILAQRPRGGASLWCSMSGQHEAALYANRMFEMYTLFLQNFPSDFATFQQYSSKIY